MENNTISWFEIPVKDIARASKFYGEILKIEFKMDEMEGAKLAVFPHEKTSVGGCLIEHKEYEPSNKGTMVYLNGGADLQLIQDRIEAAGGKVVLPKKSLGEHGFYAWFLDSEGNRVALHSMK